MIKVTAKYYKSAFDRYSG